MHVFLFSNYKSSLIKIKSSLNSGGKLIFFWTVRAEAGKILQTPVESNLKK